MSALTIGICAYNEEWNIGNLLSNILDIQAIPPNAEVIVVCSGSRDNTAGVVEHYAQKDSRVRLIEETVRRGKAAAVNRILSEARGDEIIFVSADVVPKPGCFRKLTSFMDDRSVGIACGKPEPVQRGRVLIRGIVKTLWGFHNWQLERLNHEGLLRHASEVFCIRKGIVKEIPRDIVNDDAFLAVAAKDMGYRITYAPDSRVEIFGPQTIRDYLKQRRRIIAGHYQIRRVTGKFSQYLLYGLLTRPKITLKMITGYFAQRPSHAALMATALIEIIANFLALSDIVRGRSFAIWSISSTTKTPSEL